MNMTLEQAINILHPKTTLESYTRDVDSVYPYYVSKALAYDEACILACESMQREVEKQKGCSFCKIELDGYPYICAHGEYRPSDTIYEPVFCPMCGKPLNDGKVEGDEK